MLNAVHKRVLTGALLPPFIGGVMVWFISVYKYPPESFYVALISMLGFILTGFLMMGFQALIYSLLMEFVVDTEHGFSFVLISGVLGAVASFSVPNRNLFMQFNLSLIIIGVVVGFLMGWLLLKMRASKTNQPDSMT